MKLNIKKTKLDNGLTLLTEKIKSDSITIEITANVGSIDETDDIRGISHFVEHMLFEGTKKRRNNLIIANEIEKYGAEFNAFTSNERTTYYIKIIKKHFDIALDILADMVKNPLFEPKIVEKERKVILNEINMMFDDPRKYQWVIFQSNIFEKHPAKYLVSGTKESVRAIKREDIVKHFKKYYVPDNIIVSIVGDINQRHVFEKIKKCFGSLKKGNIEVKRDYEFYREPEQSKKEIKEKRKILQSYMVLGYKTVPRNHKDSYVLDVIKAVLGRGQSGRLYQEIRNKRGLAYSVGAENDCNVSYGFFAVALNTHKKNIQKITGLILKEFKKLKNIKQSEICDAKTFIEGVICLMLEDSAKRADIISSWALNSNIKGANEYLKNIMKVTKKDIQGAVDKYLTNNYLLAVIEQQK